jgi:hypothetical protein
MTSVPQQNGEQPKPICTAQLLERIERVRKSTYALRVFADDETVDATLADALAFTAEEQEIELEAIAAGVRALLPA